MSQPFKRRRTIDLPGNAERFRRAGKPWAKWADARGVIHKGRLVERDGAARVLIETEAYYGEFEDSDGKTRRVALGTDYDAAAAQLKALRNRAHAERAGIVPKAQRRATESIDAHLSDFLKAIGTLSKKRRRKARPVSPAYRAECERQLKAIFAACGFTRPADIKAEPVEAFLDQLTADGKGARTVDSYLQTLQTFARWAKANGRIEGEPLASIHERDEDADTRRNRRALTDAECVALVNAALRRPVDNGRFFVEIDGREVTDQDRRIAGLKHALTWKMLILTCLRKGELTALRWGDVDLENEALDVRAEIAKSGNARTVVIRSDLAADLRAWRELCGNPGDEAAVIGVPQNLVRVFRKDLAAAGIAVDTADGSVDVHALRTTGVTRMRREADETVAAKHAGHGKSRSVTAVTSGSRSPTRGRHWTQPRRSRCKFLSPPPCHKSPPWPKRPP